MLRRIIENNLRKPEGFFGHIIGYRLKSNLPEYVEILKYLDLQKGMKLLEIGYGPGYGMNYIHKNNDVHIDGIDFSELMYKKACRTNKSYMDRTNLLFGDFTEQAFEDGYYDRVLMMNVIYFWKNPLDNLKKIIGIVKNGGIAGISIASPDLLAKLQISSNNIFTKHPIPFIVDILKNGDTVVDVFEDKNIQGYFYIIARKN
jgi:SAM-dependent methyltransferase